MFADAASGVRTSTRESSGGLACVPATGALYCAGGTTLPVRFDTLTGKLLWRSAAGASPTAGVRYEYRVLGVAGQVLLVRQNALAAYDNDRTSAVVALDTRTGARLWSRALVTGSETGPALAAGLALVPDAGGRTVTARSPRDGARMWSAPLPAGHSCAFPASAGGLYAVCSSYVGAGADTRLLRVDPADGTVRTLATLAPRSTYLGVLDGRHVFAEESGSGASDLDETAYGRAVLVDGTTGQRRAVPLAGTPRGPVTLTGGLLCFTLSNGLVTAHAPTTGERLWQSRTTLEQGAPRWPTAGAGPCSWPASAAGWPPWTAAGARCCGSRTRAPAAPTAASGPRSTVTAEPSRSPPRTARSSRSTRPTRTAHRPDPARTRRRPARAPGARAGRTGVSGGGGYGRASIRSRASLANASVSRSTWMRLTSLPSARDSRVQTRWGRSMRFMVEQKHTVRSRKTISLPSGAKRFARRRTRFSSVPMAHLSRPGRPPGP